ncbi:MAG: hypothetical protein NWE84_05335 [Candidatus Bathyarchaeota archaeon]|nr:hypothetical protein [Candidatus Bathyarchaeota archaeon]
MTSGNLTENIAKIVSYCTTSKSKAQIMSEMSFNDSEIDAYTAILIRYRLIEQDFKEYRTTKLGMSYLDTRNRVRIASKIRFG